MLETYRGACHCGSVSFDISIDLEEALLVRCNCSLCRRKKATVGIVAAENFRLLSGETLLSAYRWNTKREEHYFCSQCGIYTHHTLAEAPARMGFNLSCVETIDVDTLSPITGDGASLPLA